MRPYLNPNTNIITKLGSDVRDTAINYILFPLALFLGILSLATLILLAFGRDHLLGESGKLIVGILVPLIIILCFNKSIGNFILMLWIKLLILIFVVVPMLVIIYMCLKPAFNYLQF